jgi:integral membrane protein (TIGR01906 family)
MRPASAGKRAAEGDGEPSAGTASSGSQPGSRADRKAAEAAAGPSGKRQGASKRQDAAQGQDASQGQDAARGRDAVFNEPLPTSALQIRPPEEEVERRNAEREQAAKAKPILPRVMQVLLAICYPVILLVLAVRVVASPLFLWAEYNRPGFPGDGYGFNTDDRMTYGSYAVDYLSNWSGPRYLGELVSRSGDKLFKDGEVSHMADVKLVILSAFAAGAVLVLLSLIAMIYLRRRSAGGVRRGLFAGSIITLALITGLGVFATLGWQQFFTEFHRIFFADGTWTFSLQDTLIRLFPTQFWVDAGIVIGALVLLASLLTLILTWPTRKRRGLPKKARAKDAAGAGQDAVQDEDPRVGGDADEPADPDTERRGAHPAPEQGASEQGASGHGASGHAATRSAVDPVDVRAEVPHDGGPLKFEGRRQVP